MNVIFMIIYVCMELSKMLTIFIIEYQILYNRITINIKLAMMEPVRFVINLTQVCMIIAIINILITPTKEYV